MKTAFATTCRGRLHDLQKTLPVNLAALGADEFIALLDYNSDDGLREWVLKCCVAELEAGLLRFYSEQTASRFIHAHAKNVAHLIGVLHGADVLVNLDADNRLSPTFMADFRDVDWSTTLMTSPQSYSGGLRGRVGIRANFFCRLGGYDEKLVYGYGYEEIDLERRARLLCRLEDCSGAFCQVRVPTEDTILTPAALKLAAQKAEYPGLLDSQHKHQAICEDNLRHHLVIANRGQAWGSAALLDHLGAKITITFPPAAAI